KPASDLELASHHCGIAAVNGQINVFKNHEHVWTLHVVEKMDQRGPWTLSFDRSENRLMVRRGLAGSDCGIFNQDVVFAGDFLNLIKQSRGFRRIFELRLMLLHPLIALRPGIALSYVHRLLGKLASPCSELLLRARDCAPQRT